MILTREGTAPTLDNFKIAEEGLLAQTGGKLAVWSGRAATAFYHAYKLAMRRRPEVQAPEIIMPAMSCTTAANVAAMMGIKPRFADIELKFDFYSLPTLETIKAAFSSNTIAVVLIHLFGNPILETDSIKNWCWENNLLLIEDPTQALGGYYPFSRDYLGSKGDVTLYSFNKTKIIEAGNGVLVANSDEIAAELEQVLAEEKTPFPAISEEERHQLAVNYRNMHHSLVSVLRANPQNAASVSQTFLEKRAEFEPLYLHPVNSDIDLNAAWEKLGEALNHRFHMAERYAEKIGRIELINNQPVFADEFTPIVGFKYSHVCWRFSFYIHDQAQQVPLSEAVRKDGFHVSNLYWPVNQFFNPSDECPNADWLARRIINLWVDTSVDDNYVERCAESVVRHAEELL